MENDENNRGENYPLKKDCKKSFCIKDYKDNTIRSLNEVEYFLHNWNKAFKCFHIYKTFK